MDKQVLFIFLILSVLVTFSKGNFSSPYCHIRRCPANMHTLCKFSIFNPAPQCGIVIRLGLLVEEEKKILDLHNNYRRYVYAGYEVRGNPGPLPKSMYSQDLHWDHELAIIAQAWAEQCAFLHDECRNVERWVVGQNYGYESTLGNVEVLTVDLIINKWYEEVKRFNRSIIYEYNRYVAETTKTHRFSQMIWQYTKRIGCGSIRYYDGSFKRFFLVCNYGHKGNFAGKPVYQVYN